MNDGSSNLEKMRESLHRDRLVNPSTRDNSDGGESPSPEDYYPANIRIKRMRRNKYSYIPWQLIKSLVIVSILAAIFSFIDLGRYRQWVEVRKILPVLREDPRNVEAVVKLEKLAGEIDWGSIALKSGVEGVLAIRSLGLAHGRSGFGECEGILAKYPGAWVNDYLSPSNFFDKVSRQTPRWCTACQGRGTIEKAITNSRGEGICRLCKGAGKCLRCNGAGHRNGGDSRPAGSGTMRHSGAFKSLDSPCFTCKKSGRCPGCGGRGTAPKAGYAAEVEKVNCQTCNGNGEVSTASLSDEYSSSKATAQYKKVIDYIMQLYPRWVVGVVECQHWLRERLTGVFSRVAFVDSDRENS